MGSGRLDRLGVGGAFWMEGFTAGKVTDMKRSTVVLRSRGMVQRGEYSTDEMRPKRTVGVAGH